MRCSLMRVKFQDLLEERLPPEAAAQIQAHIRACPDCARALAAHERLWQMLDSLTPAGKAPDLEHAIMAQLKQLAGIPKGLVFLFVLACLTSVYGLFSRIDELGIGRDLVSAYLWAVAGGVSVLSLTLAVWHRNREKAVRALQEEKEHALTL